jgi:hypothetical protein
MTETLTFRPAQLSRTDAHRFYEQLGFNRSHLGMKISLK